MGQFWCSTPYIIRSYIILICNWLWVCEYSLNMGWGKGGFAWQQAHCTCANPLGQIIEQHSHVLDSSEWVYEEAWCHLAPQYQGPFSSKQINQRVDGRRHCESNSYHVLDVWPHGWQRICHPCHSVVKETLACAILTVAPNFNQMGSRVAITDTSIVGDYRKYTRERWIGHLSDAIISPLTHTPIHQFKQAWALLGL